MWLSFLTMEEVTWANVVVEQHKEEVASVVEEIKEIPFVVMEQDCLLLFEVGGGVWMGWEFGASEGEKDWGNMVEKKSEETIGSWKTLDEEKGKESSSKRTWQ